MRFVRILTIGILVGVFSVQVAFSDDLAGQIQNTRSACIGISDSMSNLKKMAGINTAVTAIGAAAGGVALGAGMVKKNVDENYAEIKAKLAKMIAEDKNPSPNVLANKADFYRQIDEFLQKDPDSSTAVKNDSELLDKLEQKSKTLGNIRTGTLATSAIADTAGAVIATQNKVDDTLQARINECIAEIGKLKSIKIQTQIEQSADSETTAKAEEIINGCGELEVIDLSKINKKATNATISSGTGAALAIVGTVTSASANSDSVRNKQDNTAQKLDTASNVLAGGTTVASAVATIFNATQISAIKKAVNVIDKCEGALR